MAFDDLEKALEGDERAEMRTMIQGLAMQLKLSSLLLADLRLQESNIKLANSALEYLRGEKSFS